MPVQTKTIGSRSAVFNGKADMTAQGHTADQLTRNTQGRIVLAKRSESSAGRNSSHLSMWRECVSSTAKPGDSGFPAKDTDHYKRAMALYTQKRKAPSKEEDSWF
jgi:hypothetical protein